MFIVVFTISVTYPWLKKNRNISHPRTEIFKARFKYLTI